MQFFGKCRDGKVRIFKVSIENGRLNILNYLIKKITYIYLAEELALADHKNSKGTWEQDFDTCVLPMVLEQQPCYLLYR